MWRCWTNAWHDPLLQKNPSGLIGLSLLWDHDHQTGHHNVPTLCTLGLAVTKQFGSLADHKRSFARDLLFQSGVDGSPVFVRIRNEWSLESKQLRRVITITWGILLPCLLSCLISQLGAFPGKAHMEVLTHQGGLSPISSAAATPHFSPCLPHPSASHT